MKERVALRLASMAGLWTAVVCAQGPVGTLNVSVLDTEGLAVPGATAVDD